MNSILLKSININDIINTDILLSVTELLNSINYNIDNLFIDQFWDSINDDKWIYLNDDLVLWLGYNDIRRGKDKIVKLLKKYFTIINDFKLLNHDKFHNENILDAQQVSKKDIENRGLHNKQYIIVSPDCFKELCFHIGTSKSKEIKKYYIELEKVFKFYLEYQNKYQELKLKNELETNIKNNKLDKNNYLIEKFSNKQCVYVIEVNLNEDKLIKIGSTKNIKDRISAMILSYSCECILLDIYECENNYREIEQYILTNKDIKNNLYKEKINNVMPKEIVKLSDNFNYEQLIKIIKDSIKSNIYLTPIQLLEKQKINLVNRLLDNGYNPNLFENFTINIITKNECIKCATKVNEPIIFEEPEEVNETVNEKVNENVNEEVNETVNEEVRELEETNESLQNNFSFKIKNTRGRKIQKINPNNLNVIVQVYDSMIHVLRSNDGVTYSKNPIQNAIKNKTIYKGFRWCFVEKGEDPNISKAEPTDQTRTTRITEPIVKLNETKTEIINIYNTQEECFLNNGLTKPKLRELIKSNKLFHNVYFCKITDCDSALLQKYNISNSLFKKQTRSKSIIGINPLTNEETLFKTISEIPIKLGGTEASINSAIKNKTIYNGYYWKIYKEKK